MSCIRTPWTCNEPEAISQPPDDCPQATNSTRSDEQRRALIHYSSDSDVSTNSIDDSDIDMFKRLRLHRSRSADTDDATVDRNEHGLVMRVRRSFKPTKPTKPTTPMFATVCVNNVNRSMEAHSVLRDAGLRVCSFGAGTKVSFPGRSATSPRLFGFSTSYQVMHETLQREDEARYRRNGVLKMLERNMAIKQGPTRWQALRNRELQTIDVVVCMDYNMFIKVLNDLQMRIRLSFQKKQLHVICLDTEDTPEDATSGGALALELCQEINRLHEPSQDQVKAIVVRFEKKHSMNMYYIGLTV